MASTVKIPGVGTVPTKYAVAGGVVVVVIAGVAWVRFANSRAQEEDLGPVVDDYTGVAETIYPAYSTDYAPDESYYGGAYPYPTYTTPSYGLTTTVQTPDPITNSEWTQRSIEHLELVGAESMAASLAVSRYLLKECVTPTQADLVRQAVAALGPPPQGTFSIITCPTTPSQQQDDTPPNTSQPGSTSHPPGASLPPIEQLRVSDISPTTIRVEWGKIPSGSAGVVVFADGKRVGTIYGHGFRVRGLKRNTQYTITIRPMGRDHGLGAPASVTARTEK